jgi:hypothetical protein
MIIIATSVQLDFHILFKVHVTFFKKPTYFNDIQMFLRHISVSSVDQGLRQKKKNSYKQTNKYNKTPNIPNKISKLMKIGWSQSRQTEVFINHISGLCTHAQNCCLVPPIHYNAKLSWFMVESSLWISWLSPLPLLSQINSGLKLCPKYIIPC